MENGGFSEDRLISHLAALNQVGIKLVAEKGKSQSNLEPRDAHSGS
jgi:hypothetical protein